MGLDLLLSIVTGLKSSVNIYHPDGIQSLLAHVTGLKSSVNIFLPSENYEVRTPKIATFKKKLAKNWLLFIL